MMNFLGQSGQTGLSLFCGMTGTNLGTAWVRPEPDGVGCGGKTSTILGPSSSSESTLHQQKHHLSHKTQNIHLQMAYICTPDK